MSRWFAALPLVVLAALALLFAGYGLHHDPKVIPEALVGKYQCFTQANLTRLRAAGCDHQFADVATGVSAYVQHLLTAHG